MTVRQPGLVALQALAEREYAGLKDSIPAGKFPPLWRRAMNDLLEGYARICAYVCLYIPRGTGASTVDHMVPKSVGWREAYEWSNYRLACSLMNSRKGIAVAVLDPFEVEDGWFALDPVAFQVLPARGLSEQVVKRVSETIDRLGLNDQRCRDARVEYAQEYWDGHVTFDYLSRHAPFVARELQRWGRLRPGDA